MKAALAVLAALCAGATCSRSEVRSEERREVYTLDASVRVEEAQRVEVDREEARMSGAVDTVRVVEEYGPLDGGTPHTEALIRRTTTTTHVAPSVRTVGTATRAEAHSEAVAAVAETRVTDTDKRATVESKQAVGISWPVKIALVVAALVALALVWRLRHGL